MQRTNVMELVENGAINVDFDYEKDGLELERLSEILRQRLRFYMNRAAAYCLYDLVCRSGEIKGTQGQGELAFCDAQVVDAIEQHFKTLSDGEKSFLQCAMLFQEKEVDYLIWRLRWAGHNMAQREKIQQECITFQVTHDITVRYSKRRNKLGVEERHAPDWEMLAQELNARLGLRMNFAHACSLFMIALQAGAIEGVRGRWRGCVYASEVADTLAYHLLGWRAIDLYTFLNDESIEAFARSRPNGKRVSGRRSAARRKAVR